METIKCKTCGKKIEKTVWNRKECGECRKTYHKRLHKETYVPSHHIKKCLDCNVEIETNAGLTKYCKKCAILRSRESKRIYHHRKKANAPELYLYNKSKSRAKTKSLDFNIDVEDIVIPKMCPLLNTRLITSMDKDRTDNSPSLDRIDNSKGYIKGNVIVVSWRANRLKSNGTIEELSLLVKNLKKLYNG